MVDQSTLSRLFSVIAAIDRSLLLLEHDLRANASRLSRGKPLHTPDQVEGMLFGIMLLASRPQQAALLAVPVALLLGLALVVQLLAFGQRQFHLRAPLLVEIE